MANMVASPFIIQELCGIVRNEVVLITKVGRVDWSGGGDFCGNSGIGTNAKNATSCGNAFVTNIVLARALGLSVAREKAPSRARESVRRNGNQRHLKKREYRKEGAISHERTILQPTKLLTMCRRFKNVKARTRRHRL